MFGKIRPASKPIAVLIAFASLLQACGKTDSFATLEETKALLGDTTKTIPLLTRVKASREALIGESINLDFNNEKSGSDDGMSYACTFDKTFDGNIEKGDDCTLLPGKNETQFDGKTAILTWGPLSVVGNYEIQLVGTNSSGKDSEIFTVKVFENKIPKLVDIRDQTTDANRTLTITPVNSNEATDPAPTYTCFFDEKVDGEVKESTNCDSLPTGSSKKFDSKTGIITWTPGNLAVGIYEIALTATNDAGSDKKIFPITITPDPNLPVLTKVAKSMNVFVGDSVVLDFKNEKTGNDENMVYNCTFDTTIDGAVESGSSCSSLPDAPSSKFSVTTGVFNWGPVATIGNYEIKIKGQTDAGLDEVVFVVRVVQRDAPSLTRILDKQIEANQTLLITPVNENALRGDLVTFSCTFDATVDGKVVNGNLCSQLPGLPVIKFDPSSGTLNWVPENSSVGSYEFKIKATNSYGADEKIFVLVVIPSTERKVKLGYIRNISVVTGEVVNADAVNTLTNSDTGVTYACYYDAVVDGDVANTLSCDLLTGTPAQKFNSTTGVLNWTPNLGAAVELEIKIVGSKQGDSDSRNFVVSFATQRFGDVGNSAILFDPNSWDFGSVPVSSASTAKSVTLTNNSASPVYIGSIASSNTDFVLNWSACPAPTVALAANGTCVINIGFTPTTSNQLGSALSVRFGKTAATSSDYSSVMGLSGRGVGTLVFAGLQTISAVTHNSMRLNWNANSQAASYLIFQMIGGNPVYLETLLNTGGTVNSKTLTNLNPSTSYTYRVRASDFVGVVDSNTASVTASTAANQAPSVTDGPSSWAVYTGRSITSLDFADNFSATDYDRDGDAITYSCRYDTTIDGAVSNSASLCSSIVNIDSTNVGFSQYTGVLSNWKPAANQATVGYEFKVTGTDFYGASSSTTFTTTVLSGTPVITAGVDKIFPSNYLKAGDTLSVDFNNIRFSPYNDTDMTYGCTVKTLTTTDGGSAACTTLGGTITFGTSTGILSWVTNTSSIGAYEFTVTGSNLVGSATAVTFKVDILPAIDDTHRLFHLDARFADGSRGGQNSVASTTTWKDITSSAATGTLTNFNSASAWVGSTSASNPMAASFDGSDDFVTFGSTSFATDNDMHFDTWIYQGVNTREKVIMSYGDSSDHGLILTDRRLWLGNGTNTDYSAAVLDDSPLLYWKLDSTSGGSVADSSGNGKTGGVVNSTYWNGNADDGVFNLSGSGVQTSVNAANNTSGYARPSATYTLGATWTIESWFYYPFPNNCSTGYCALVRGNTVANYPIIVQQSLGSQNMVLGVYKSTNPVGSPANGFLTSGYSMVGLSRGWHQVVAVGTGGNTNFYVDGAAVGSTVAYQPVNDVYYVGSAGSTHPFGRFDEFSIYGTALSPSRILAHYNAGNRGPCYFALNDSNWYHIAGTIEDTTNTATLYLNGSQVCSFTKPGAKTLLGSSTTLSLGRSSVGSATSWLGKISSLVLYDDGGSTSNIASNYTATSSLFSPQVPLPPAGLRLWLRADMGLFQDATRTTPAAANGDPVIAWEDQSGTGGDMTVRAATDQVTGRPLLNTTAINGKPALSFDGVNDNLQNLVSYGFPNTVFIVAHYNGASPRGRILSSVSNNYTLGWYGGFWDRYYVNNWIYLPSPTTDNSWRIYAGDHSSTIQRLFVNNQSLSSNTNGTVGPLGLNLGSQQGGSEFSISEVAEVIVYDRVLTDAERAAVFTYLNARYAVY